MRNMGNSRSQHLASAWLMLCLLVQGFFADCVPQPIAAKIGNVSLSNGNSARGIEYAVGTPPQNFAFLPQWGLNNILLYDVNGKCDNTSATACTTTRGGQYDKVSSSSREDAKQGQFPADPPRYPQMDYSTDVFKLDSNTTLKDVPVGVSLSDWGSKDYTPMMGFGMGPDSTILKALTTSKKITSRTWSFFFGLTGDQPASQLDGTWVWGGYDRAKVKGDGYEFSMQDSDDVDGYTDGDNSKCTTRLLVELNNIELNFINGTTVSLFPNSTPLKACLVPYYPAVMSMPRDPYFNNFEELTQVTTITGRSFGIDFYSLIYDSDQTPYAGDITFTIKDGPTVRITNDQLIHAERTIDDKSGAIVANMSARNLLINSLQSTTSGDLPHLGRQFFSSAYLLANEDTKKFKLWAAYATNQQDLVAIDKDGKDVTSFCAESATESSPPSRPSPSHANKGSSGLSGGSIGGVIVGAVAGVALLSAALFLLWWRRRRSKAAENLDPLATGGGSDGSNQEATKYVYPPHYHQDPYAELAQMEHHRREYYKPELQGNFSSQQNRDHYEMAG